MNHKNELRIDRSTEGMMYIPLFLGTHGGVSLTGERFGAPRSVDHIQWAAVGEVIILEEFNLHPDIGMMVFDHQRSRVDVKIVHIGEEWNILGTKPFQILI